jgi:hypothetical protein
MEWNIFYLLHSTLNIEPVEQKAHVLWPLVARNMNNYHEKPYLHSKQSPADDVVT